MRKTLVVDDMKSVYDRISSRNLMIEYDYAQNPNDAIKKINSGKYSFVITDYHLGGDFSSGGIDVARVAKENGLGVILMSTENHESEAKDIGVLFKFKKELIEDEN
jgi:CheY-like chemotaxis protein